MRDILDDGDVAADSLSLVFSETRHNLRAFERLDDLMKEPRTANHAWGMALVGPPRTGKTTLVKEYLRSCADRVEDRKPIKYLYVEITSETRSGNIAALTLHEMDDPNPSHGDPSSKGARVVDGLRRQKYDLVIYDEAHYLVDSETLRVEEKGAAWFNRILNEARVPTLLIGYERFQAVIERNPSLGGRLLPFPKFTRLDYSDAEDLAEAQFVFGELEQQLGMPTPSGLGRPETAARILVTCQGSLGLVEVFLTSARQTARRRRHSCLTAEVLRETAAEVLSDWGRVRFNPFSVDDLDRAIRESQPTKPVAKRKRGLS